MTTTRENKGFDCVKTTREIRDRLSVELAGMSPEDRVRWLNSRGFSEPLLRRLVNRLRPQEGREGESALVCSTGSPFLDAIPSTARQEANDADHGGLTAYREARKEDGVDNCQLNPSSTKQPSRTGSAGPARSEGYFQSSDQAAAPCQR